MTTFGTRLRFLRKQANLTQEQFGKILNVSPSSIGMYERGEREPSYKLLIEIATYFQVSIDYLLDHNLDGKLSFPSLSKDDEYILHMKQEHPEFFKYLTKATTTDLKKLIDILKIIQ